MSGCRGARLVRSDLEAREDWPKPLGRLLQFLGQNPYLPDDGHEVGVTGPARDEVHVEMIDDAGAGRSTEVHPDIHSLRPVRLVQRALGLRDYLYQLGPLLAVEVPKAGNVPVRDDHEVTAVVRVEVQDHEAGSPPGEQ